MIRPFVFNFFLTALLLASSASFACAQDGNLGQFAADSGSSSVQIHPSPTPVGGGNGGNNIQPSPTPVSGGTPPVTVGTTTYFWNGTTDVTSTTSWGTNIDGTGSNPSSFTASNQIFEFQSGQSTTLTNGWTVSGSGSKIVVDNGATHNIGDGGQLSGTGAITVNSGGTLAFTGTTGTDRINNSATMTLNGGTFNTGGLSEHGASNNTAGIGALTLQSNSIIDMGSGASIVAFADSHLASWTGTLSIYNYSGTPVTGNGTDQLYFGTDASGLTSAQVGEIAFFSDSGTTSLGGATILADGEVVVAPEPSTWMGAALALGAVVFTQRRRLLRSISP